MRDRLQITIFLLAGIGLAVFGTWATLQELSPYLVGSQSNSDTMVALSDGPLTPGLAITTQRDFLLKCNTAANSYSFLRQTEEQQAALSNVCQTQANAMATGQGANSLAWLVSAQMAARQSDFVAMNEGLRRSYATGASEQWLAALRFDLAESYLANVAPDVSASHDADIRLMATSDIALGQLVGRYLSNESFRTRLIAIIETMPDNQQRRFVRSVQQTTSRQGARTVE